MNTNRSKTVALWIVGIAVLGVSFYFDDALVAFVKSNATPAVVAFGRLGSHYGEWPFLMIPCLIALFIAWRRKNAAAIRVICTMMICSTLAGIGADVVRGLTGRTRPNAPPTVEQGWYGPRANRKWVIIKSEYNAFPSAHAAASMGLIAPLLLLRRRLGWLLLPVPILIAAARVCAEAHHLSDVIAGALVGIAVAQWANWKIAPLLSRWRLD